MHNLIMLVSAEVTNADKLLDGATCHLTAAHDWCCSNIAISHHYRLHMQLAEPVCPCKLNLCVSSSERFGKRFGGAGNRKVGVIRLTSTLEDQRHCWL